MPMFDDAKYCAMFQEAMLKFLLNEETGELQEGTGVVPCSFVIKRETGYD